MDIIKETNDNRWQGCRPRGPSCTVAGGSGKPAGGSSRDPEVQLGADTGMPAPQHSPHDSSNFWNQLGCPPAQRWTKGMWGLRWHCMRLWKGRELQPLRKMNVKGRIGLSELRRFWKAEPCGPCSVAPGFYTDRYNRRCAYDVDGKWETEGLKGPGRKGPWSEAVSLLWLWSCGWMAALACDSLSTPSSPEVSCGQCKSQRGASRSFQSVTVLCCASILLSDVVRLSSPRWVCRRASGPCCPQL